MSSVNCGFISLICSSTLAAFDSTFHVRDRDRLVDAPRRVCRCACIFITFKLLGNANDFVGVPIFVTRVRFDLVAQVLLQLDTGHVLDKERAPRYCDVLVEKRVDRIPAWVTVGEHRADPGAEGRVRGVGALQRLVCQVLAFKPRWPRGWQRQHEGHCQIHFALRAVIAPWLGFTQIEVRVRVISCRNKCSFIQCTIENIISCSPYSDEFIRKNGVVYKLNNARANYMFTYCNKC